MIMRGLMAAVVAVSSVASFGVGPASASDQLRIQVGHQLARIGYSARAADALDRETLARIKLELGSDNGNNASKDAVNRLLAQ
jgi:hypothetical protein